MYAVTVTFQIAPDQIGDFVPLILENARTSRRVEPGCQQFDVCHDQNEVFLYEIYDDQAAFQMHLDSDHFKAFEGAIHGMVQGKQVRLFEEVMR